MLFKTIQYAYLTFMLCISILEAEFSSKQTYLRVMEQFITEKYQCKDVHIACENFRVGMKVIVMEQITQ